MLKRTITSLVLMPLVIYIVLQPRYEIYLTLIILLLIFAGWEMAHLIGWETPRKRSAFITLVIVLTGLCYCLPAALQLLLFLVYWMFALYCLSRFPEATEYWRHWLIRTILGSMALVSMAIALLQIRLATHGYYVLAGMLFVWAADTGAYCAGKLWGQRKLAPSTSPGKTWEGAFGGMLLTLVAAISFAAWYFPTKSVNWWLQWLLLALLTSATSILGDLFISMLKRQRRVKNTGSLLPGHGGLLDRVDGLLLSMLVFYGISKLMNLLPVVAE